MPVTGVTMRQIIRRKATVRKLDDLHPGVLSDRVQFHRDRARAQRLHPWRLPWRPHAYRAALRVSPASKFSERYPSFPPNFTSFGHFLQPTTTWICFNQTFLCPFMQKNLGPLESGLNRKRSDFLDLPNGLKTCLSTPPRSLVYDVRYVNIFMKAVLTPYENVVLY